MVTHYKHSHSGTGGLVHVTHKFIIASPYVCYNVCS